MKRRTLIFMAFLLLFCSGVFGQSMNVVVMDNLQNLSFGNFVLGNDMPSGEIYFQVIMGPDVTGEIQVYGEFYWKEWGTSDYKEMVRFLTKRFPARSFTNQDLGKSIRIVKDRVQNQNIQRNLDKGKPTGEYRLKLKLLRPGLTPGEFDLDNTPDVIDHRVLLTTAETSFSVTIPSQTLVITHPEMNSIQDQGNFQIEWTPIEGVSNYEIRANYKQYALQSNEDALRGNDPVINNVNVGNVTVANMATMLSRTLEPGKFVVIQVTGVVANTTMRFQSQPVCILVRPQLSAQQQALVNSLQTTLGSGLTTVPPEFLTALQNGTISILGIVGDNGVVMTEQQVQQIWAYLQAHPEAITSVKLVIH